MRMIIGGGCGEHGRSCYLLEGSRYNVMVDCGVMAGVAQPMPRLTPEQIRQTRYVLLTHSHKDHTGAMGWLLENGFTGCFVMTAETALQLPWTVPSARILPAPEETRSIALDGMKIKYGMSGHCPGAVWYLLHWEGKRVLFSGDYNLYSYVYECTLVKGRKADIAVIDSAYAKEDEDRYRAFSATLGKLLGHTEYTLLPVPQYGRGLELLLLLMRFHPQVCITLDSHLQGELARLKFTKKWIRPDAYGLLRQWKPRHKSGGPHVLLLADPQLSSPVGRSVASIYVQEKRSILFSGFLDKGSYAKELVSRGKAMCQILPVHNTDAEYKLLREANHFQRTIPCHTDRLNGPTDLVF